MKRLIITCKDEDLVKLVGTCVKIDADFTVETVAEAPVKAARKLHREGLNTSEKVVAYLSQPDMKGHATFTQIRDHLVEVGYAESTASGVLSKLRAAGRVVQSGNIWALVA